MNRFLTCLEESIVRDMIEKVIDHGWTNSPLAADVGYLTKFQRLTVLSSDSSVLFPNKAATFSRLQNGTVEKWRVDH
jgi:hypothetical protein